MPAATTLRTGFFTMKRDARLFGASAASTATIRISLIGLRRFRILSALNWSRVASEVCEESAAVAELATGPAGSRAMACGEPSRGARVLLVIGASPSNSVGSATSVPEFCVCTGCASLTCPTACVPPPQSNTKVSIRGCGSL